MVPKAFKEVKQQVDIVGKGRGDHGDSSWKGFAVFSRRTCHYRLCQVIYAHPSDKYYASGGFEAARKAPLALFDTTAGLVIFSKFPIIQDKFVPFKQFTPSVIERIGRKGILEATIKTPYGTIIGRYF